jgi:hypothetical protein
MCDACGRHFVVTADHVAGRARGFETEPLSALPDASFVICDFCSADAPIEKVNAGLRQKTCAACHTEFLRALGIPR